VVGRAGGQARLSPPPRTIFFPPFFRKMEGASIHSLFFSLSTSWQDNGSSAPAIAGSSDFLFFRRRDLKAVGSPAWCFDPLSFFFPPPGWRSQDGKIRLGTPSLLGACSLLFPSPFHSEGKNRSNDQLFSLMFLPHGELLKLWTSFSLVRPLFSLLFPGQRAEHAVVASRLLFSRWCRSRRSSWPTSRSFQGLVPLSSTQRTSALP